MSTAHTCFRTALIQAFRPSNRAVAAPCSVAAFLVPALGKPTRRAFTLPRRRSDEAQLFPATLDTQTTHDAAAHGRPPKPTQAPLQSFIPYPPSEALGDIEAWLDSIEPFLPTHLQREPSLQPDISATVTPLDLALVLNEAQKASLDILSHIGLVEGRWRTVVWMAKKLAEGGKRPVETHLHLQWSATVATQGGEHQTLKEMTEAPVYLNRFGPLSKLHLELDVLTSAPESIELRNRAIKRALGQVWTCLGGMILVAAERHNSQDSAIMPHALEIIAYLHHIGYMPDSVYTYRPHQDVHALQQPPTLHMLSTKILTALSDATWNAHEASVKTAKDRANAQYFLGHEIPGSRYNVQITQVAPELWLELVLWSCIHGGWVLDGTAILKQLAAKQGEERWSLISWKEIMQAEQQQQQQQQQHQQRALRSVWSLLPMMENVSAGPADRARTRRTISSEVVTAIIDGLINQMRLGVGMRGADPEVLIDSIKTLKTFLDANDLSLGSTAWDSIMVRLLESGGFIPWKRPELLLRIFELAPGFGTEVGAANTSTLATTEVPYFFEPTTVPLSLLHRAMRFSISNGDIKSAVTTLSLLQQHTDDNKQKSVQQFFELLKSTPQLRRDEPFTSQLPPVSFPAFDVKLPIPLLARLLDLATDLKMYELGHWLLHSEDLDGPLIKREFHSHRTIAASIVRYGTLAGDNDLVLEVIKKASTWNTVHQQQRMPAEILISLLCCQFKLRRWDSVRDIQEYLDQTSSFRPRPIILSTFAAELLRTSDESQESKARAREAFVDLLFDWEEAFMTNMRIELYCILSILSTVNHEWKTFCSQFLAYSTRQDVQLATDDFNRILGGIVDGYGSAKGKQIVHTWCYKPPKTYEAYRAPGGLATMPRYRVTKGERYEERPEDIEIAEESGTRLILQGRVHPNRQTIWIVLRKVKDEVEDWRRQSEGQPENGLLEARATLKWAARLLYYLGLDYEEVVRDFGSLAELAQLEAPAAASDFGPGDSLDMLLSI